MINYIIGDIFNSGMQTIVNPVNTQGVMGSGLALYFRILLPGMYKDYREICKKKLLKPGTLWLYNYAKRWRVLCFPTKESWMSSSSYTIIEQGLQKFISTYKEKGITSVAFPILGAGLGKLDNKTVLGIMRRYLEPLDIPVEIWSHRKGDGDFILEEIKKRSDPRKPIYQDYCKFTRIRDYVESIPDMTKDEMYEDIGHYLEFDTKK
jgi:O-acetyl-ADP-ribose deacetylase (regulator of RNase III)